MAFGSTGTDDLGGIAGWVVDVIDRMGVGGVGALSVLDSIIPTIPSEVVLSFAGFASSQGDLNMVAAWVAATIGAVLGAWVLYGLSALVGSERLHTLAAKRWFLLFNPHDLERGEKFFERHGTKIVLIGRCIPFLRCIVSVPAGVERMPLARFTVLTAIGSAVWNAIFILAGRAAGDRWEDIEGWVTPLAYAVIAILGVAFLWLIVRKLMALRRLPAS